MEAKEPHEILGVERNATIEEIRTAFKKMALKVSIHKVVYSPLKWHPDKHPEEMKEEVQALCSALNLPRQRKCLRRYRMPMR